MNLPNRLTLFRILLVPVLLVILFMPAIPEPLRRHIAVSLFVLASLTDALDGYIARRYNQVTNFGKLMDPLADKVLVCSVLVAMVELGDLPSAVVIIIIAREFMITGFRALAADKRVVLAASHWGKLKTVFQMLMIIVVLLGWEARFFYIRYMEWSLIFLAVFFTIVSGLEYLFKNLSLLRDTDE